MARFRTFLHLMTAAGVAAAVMGAPGRAEAGFVIRVSTDGGTTFSTVTDNNTVAPTGTLLADFNTDVGGISSGFSSSIANFTMVGGNSKPLFGNTAGYSVMDISILGSFKNGGGTVIIDITDTDWQPPANFAGPGNLSVTLGNQMTAGITSHSASGYIVGDDPGTAGAQGNVEFGGLPGVNNNGGIVYGPVTASGTVGNPTNSLFLPTVGSPYSMTMRVVFSGTSGGFSFDDKITFTPAPASLMMAAAGVPMLGVGAWFRRRKTATPTVA